MKIKNCQYLLVLPLLISILIYSEVLMAASAHNFRLYQVRTTVSAQAVFATNSKDSTTKNEIYRLQPGDVFLTFPAYQYKNNKAKIAYMDKNIDQMKFGYLKAVDDDKYFYSAYYLPKLKDNWNSVLAEVLENEGGLKKNEKCVARRSVRERQVNFWAGGGYLVDVQRGDEVQCGLVYGNTYVVAYENKKWGGFYHALVNRFAIMGLSQWKENIERQLSEHRFWQTSYIFLILALVVGIWFFKKAREYLDNVLSYAISGDQKELFIGALAISSLCVIMAFNYFSQEPVWGDGGRSHFDPPLIRMLLSLPFVVFSPVLLYIAIQLTKAYFSGFAAEKIVDEAMSKNPGSSYEEIFDEVKSGSGYDENLSPWEAYVKKRKIDAVTELLKSRKNAFDSLKDTIRAKEDDQSGTTK